MAVAFVGALVASGSGFAARSQTGPAAALAGTLPTCTPIQGPGSVPYEPNAVFFDFGSAAIHPDAAAVLKNAATAYRPFPKCILEVSGHTDSLEAASYGPHLAARRAKAVIRFLRRLGVTMRTRINVLGDTRPLVETPKGAAEPQNRFVVFVMVPETSG
jgi:outer membrane protein OmpA-like peptidoglycan-associated protein